VGDATSHNQAGQGGQGRNKTKTHFHTQSFQLMQNIPTLKKVPSSSIDGTAWRFVQPMMGEGKEGLLRWRLSFIFNGLPGPHLPPFRLANQT
jgi:hypothetical protein